MTRSFLTRGTGILLLVGILAACGNNTPSPSTPAASTSSQPSAEPSESATPSGEESATPRPSTGDPIEGLPADHLFNDSARMQEEITLFFGQASFGSEQIDGQQVLRAVNPSEDELIIYPGEATNTVQRLTVIDVNAQAETSMEGSPDSSPIFPLVMVLFPEGEINAFMLETIQRGIDTPEGVTDSQTFGRLKLTIEAFTADHDDEIVIDIEVVE